MVVLTHNTSAPIVRGPETREFSLSTFQVDDVISTGTTSVVSVDDRTYDQTLTATVDEVFIVDVTQPITDSAILTSATPAICTVDSVSGRVSRVSDGECVIEGASARGSGWATRIVRGPVNRAVGHEISLLRIATGNDTSLRKEINSLLTFFSESYTPGATSQDLYSAVDYSANTFTVNTSLAFPYASQLTCASFKSSHPSLGQQNRHSCFFVTPRHAIYAKHVGVWFQTVTARRGDGSTQTVNRVSEYNFPGADLAIGYYDANVTGVTFAKFMTAANCTNYLPGLVQPATSLDVTLPCLSLLSNTGEGSGYPGLVIPTNSHRFRMQSIRSVYQTTSGNYDFVFNYGMSHPVYEPWYMPPYGGDSGSGTFLPVQTPDTDLILVGVQHTAASGPWLPSYVTQLQAKANELALAAGESSPSYSLQLIDLSEFTVYNP